MSEPDGQPLDREDGVEIDTDASESRRGGRTVVIALLAGLVVGVTGTILAPRFLGPYLPAAVRGGGSEPSVTGYVAAKRLEENRLLLTVVTAEGAVLATFKQRVPEIDLLVDEGDTLSLGLMRYRPFVEDPEIRGVRKRRSGASTGEGEMEVPRKGSGPSDEPEAPGGDTIVAWGVSGAS